MSSYKKYSSLVLSFLLAFTLTSFSQSQIELSVQCLLSDAGEKITNEQFELNVKLNYTGENENLWQYSETRTTDESGWFNFSIPAISQYLDLEGNAQKPLIITMRFLPTSYTKWDITGVYLK